VENGTFWCILGAIYARLTCGKLGLNNPEKIWGGARFGGPVPPWPQRRTVTVLEARSLWLNAAINTVQLRVAFMLPRVCRIGH